MSPKVMPAVAESVARHALTFGAGFLFSKGIISAEQAPEAIGLGMAGVSLVWSALNKKKTKKRLKAAMRAPAEYVP